MVFAHTRQVLLREHLRRTLTAIAEVTPLTPCDNCRQALDPDFTIRVLGDDTIINLCSWGCVAELTQDRDTAFKRLPVRDTQTGGTQTGLADDVARHVQNHIDEEDSP